MDLNAFISENYIVIVIVGIITVMTIIGYFAQKTEFGKKVSKKNKKEKNIISNDVALEEIKEKKIETEDKEENLEELDIFDTIEPDFNDGGLMIGDVNQNPEISNEQLGINEDLYAPFGDEKNEPGIEELKIEEVEEINDFIIDEKKDKNNSDEELFEDINQSLDINNNLNVENIEIEEISQEENEEKLFAEAKKENMVVEEINNIVDNTFVLNEATTELEKQMEERHDLDAVSEIVEEKKENDENAEEENTDLETTTTLKLDEINEKIKNLKLEDLDNLNFEEDVISEPKRKKKNKKVTIKTVEDIKQTKESAHLFNNEIINEFELPTIEDFGQQNEEITEQNVSETDSEWNF